ncbi:catabolite repressor/activator [Vibrio sp. RC27]
MTIGEVAKLAGVSKTTVSCVINGQAAQNRISKETQKRIMTIVKQYNSQPTRPDSVLSDDESRCFGLIITDIENTSNARFIKRFEKLAREAGFTVLVSSTEDDPEIEKSIAQALVTRRVDALIVETSLGDGTGFYKAIQDTGTPVIAIDRSLDDEFFSCVISEDFGAAFDLSASIISPSITSIGLIGALPELSVSRERQLGFEFAVKKKGIRSVVAHGQSFSREEGARLFSEWVEQGCVPDSIVCTSHSLLEGVLDVLNQHDELLSMVRLATFGDSNLLDFLPFRINSVPQQYDLFAKSALAFALDAADHNYQSGVELIPRILKVRKK